MALALPEMHALRSLTPDGRLLFATRVVRMAAYGALSVVLALYLTMTRELEAPGLQTVGRKRATAQ